MCFFTMLGDANSLFCTSVFSQFDSFDFAVAKLYAWPNYGS